MGWFDSWSHLCSEEDRGSKGKDKKEKHHWKGKKDKSWKTWKKDSKDGSGSDSSTGSPGTLRVRAQTRAVPPEEQRVDRSRPRRFEGLFDVFEFLDPTRTGYIKNRATFEEVITAITGRAATDSYWRRIDKDGNGAVNFPEFVEWAQQSGLALPIGLRDENGEIIEGIELPVTWAGPVEPAKALRWNMRSRVTDGDLFLALQDLLDVTYKKVWTRDRKATGINVVPEGFQLQRAFHSENFSDWKRYMLKRHELSINCKTRGYHEVYESLTSKAAMLYARHAVRTECNEWLLFHGTSAAAAEAICRGDFRLHLSGTATGTLYGRGTYFADSITKADEYAKTDEDGNCCALVCRVIGGRVLYNDEVEPDAQELQDLVLKEGLYASILGDREKARGTFKEYVIFDADQVYVEYVLIYKRIYP